METVSLQISKDIVNPIVEAKVKEAILEAMGGRDKVITTVVNEVLTRKVNAEGKISQYSSDNKYTWLDAIVTQQIRTAVENELKTLVSESSAAIKEELIKQLQTKKGASAAASALLAALNGSFAHNWTSKLDIQFRSQKEY